MINVLPENEKLIVSKEYKFRLLTVVFFMIAIFVITSTVLLVPNYVFSKNKHATLKRQIESLNQIDGVDAGNSLSSIVADINKNLDLLNTVPQNISVIENILSPVLKSKGPGIKISKLNYTISIDNKRTLEVAGKSTDRAALKNLEESLKKYPTIEKVDLPVSNFSKRTNINFFLTVTFK